MKRPRGASYPYSAVAGNVARVTPPGADRDFPIYVPRPLKIRQELKCIDTLRSSSVPLLASPLFVSPGTLLIDQYIDFPTPGDGIDKRLSDRVWLYQLQFRATVRGPLRIQPAASPGAAPVQAELYFYIIWDRFPQGDTIPYGDIFTPDTSGVDTVVPPFIAPAARDRFEILVADRFILAQTRIAPSDSFNPVVANPDERCFLDYDIPLERVSSFRLLGGGNPASMVTGAIFYCLLQLVAPNLAPTPPALPQQFLSPMYYQARLQFADL